MSEARDIRPVANLVAKVLDEIERVVALRERWRVYANEFPPSGRVTVNLRVGIDGMTLTIEAAKAAIAGDDVVATLRALHSLEMFADG